METTTIATTSSLPAGPWTPSRPARPGQYLWRSAPDARPESIRIDAAVDFVTLPEGGEWAPTRVQSAESIDVCWRMYAGTLP